MSEFQNALDLVHASLVRMREQGSTPSASILSLQALTTPIRIPRDGIPSPAPSVVRETPIVPAKAEKMASIRTRALACVKCPHLVRTRENVVFGVGNIDAELMFVGEAPGVDEDLAAEPFVGRASPLLTRIIETMGYARADVYIANILKCRPDTPPGAPGNRKPVPDEMAACRPFLIEQIAAIQPKALVALGATAMEGLLNTAQPMRELRGRWHEFQGIPLMATYHPSYLLRNQSPAEKRKVWEDMLEVLKKLGRPISEKQQAYFLPK